MPNLISTYSGKVIDVNNPKPEDICIEDIAHALSLLCRFNGQCDFHYSVAQHSVLVMHQVSYEIKLEALLHDAAEAYVGDLSTPVKMVLRQEDSSFTFDLLEGRFHRAIDEKFKLAHKPLIVELIHKADLAALATEKRDICSFSDKVPWPCLENVKPLTNTLLEQSHSMAEFTFIEYFKILMEKRK